MRSASCYSPSNPYAAAHRTGGSLPFVCDKTGEFEGAAIRARLCSPTVCGWNRAEVSSACVPPSSESRSVPPLNRVLGVVLTRSGGFHLVSRVKTTHRSGFCPHQQNSHPTSSIHLPLELSTIFKLFQISLNDIPV